MEHDVMFDVIDDAVLSNACVFKTFRAKAQNSILRQRESDSGFHRSMALEAAIREALASHT